MVELGQAEVQQLQDALLRVHNDVLWLHVAVHDSSRVAEIERLEQLVHIEADFKVCELGKK